MPLIADPHACIPCRWCRHPVTMIDAHTWQHVPFPGSPDWPYGWYRCRGTDRDRVAAPRRINLWLYRLVYGYRPRAPRIDDRTRATTPRYVDVVPDRWDTG